MCVRIWKREAGSEGVTRRRTGGGFARRETLFIFLLHGAVGHHRQGFSCPPGPTLHAQAAAAAAAAALGEAQWGFAPGARESGPPPPPPLRPPARRPCHASKGACGSLLSEWPGRAPHPPLCLTSCRAERLGPPLRRQLALIASGAAGDPAALLLPSPCCGPHAGTTCHAQALAGMQLLGPHRQHRPAGGWCPTLPVAAVHTPCRSQALVSKACFRPRGHPEGGHVRVAT